MIQCKSGSALSVGQGNFQALLRGVMAAYARFSMTDGTKVSRSELVEDGPNLTCASRSPCIDGTGGMETASTFSWAAEYEEHVDDESWEGSS